MSKCFNGYMNKMTIMFIIISCTLALIVDNKDMKNDKPKISKDSKGTRDVLEATTTLFLSGLFDRSFFITTFMAIKYNKLVVLISASIALSFVGAISVFMGVAINNYIPAVWVDGISILLFLFFGFKMIIEGLQTQNNEDLLIFEEPPKIKMTTNEEDTEYLINNNDKCIPEASLSGDSSHDLKVVQTSHPHSHDLLDLKKECDEFSDKNSSFQVFCKIFILVFASEIGDRSQISTIYLTNNIDKFVVLMATFLSQNLLTILAIFGGKLISTRMSERNLTIIAGTTFILFGIGALYLLCLEHINLFGQTGNQPNIK